MVLDECASYARKELLEKLSDREELARLIYCDECHTQIDTVRCTIQFYTKHHSPHWEELELCEKCGDKVKGALNLKLKTVDVSGMMS